MAAAIQRRGLSGCCSRRCAALQQEIAAVAPAAGETDLAAHYRYSQAGNVRDCRSQPSFQSGLHDSHWVSPACHQGNGNPIAITLLGNHCALADKQRVIAPAPQAGRAVRSVPVVASTVKDGVSGAEWPLAQQFWQVLQHDPAALMC